MSFLFLQSRVSTVTEVEVPLQTNSDSSSPSIKITRSGQAVTLCNLSFFEPQTTFRCFHEILLLLTLPALDKFFCDQVSGKLKREFVFIVDNGPAEQPASCLVQMCLIRLLKLLKLTKIKQISFAEYHSKRNFVERVHAEENNALFKHGPFSVDTHVSVGSAQHKETMESMCTEVVKSINTASFGKLPIQSHRGIKTEDYIFSDEENLKIFLTLNEDQKELYLHQTYSPKRNKLFQELIILWDVDADFEGNYMNDYAVLMNKVPNVKTAWKDKYTTAIYTPNLNVLCDRSEKQPLPDYPRWIQTKQLHFLSIEERLEVGFGVCMGSNQWAVYSKHNSRPLC